MRRNLCNAFRIPRVNISESFSPPVARKSSLKTMEHCKKIIGVVQFPVLNCLTFLDSIFCFWIWKSLKASSTCALSCYQLRTSPEASSIRVTTLQRDFYFPVRHLKRKPFPIKIEILGIDIWYFRSDTFSPPTLCFLGLSFEAQKVTSRQGGFKTSRCFAQNFSWDRATENPRQIKPGLFIEVMIIFRLITTHESVPEKWNESLSPFPPRFSGKRYENLLICENAPHSPDLY